MEDQTIKENLVVGFKTALQVALPENALAKHLPSRPVGKTYVIGAGKAAAKMAEVFESLWGGAYEGLVVTRYGHTVPTKKIKVLEAAHPVPDENSQKAALEILAFLEQVTADDLVICLLSGGGSSLLTCPVPGISFEALQDVNQQLLLSGAEIHEINTVRKHLNLAFGGKLAQAALPAKLVTLAISDVAGDDISTIASGPTVGDPTYLSDALAVLDKYNITADASITGHLQNSEHETLKPDDAVFKNTIYDLIATPQKLLEAAADYFKAQNITPHILSSMVEGDTNQAAAFHVALIKQITQYGQPFKRPCILISGGETTVKITGKGDGGPNSQFMLASALALGGLADVYGLACDTDGIDGSKDVAGAYIDAKTLERAEHAGLDAKAMLANNDAYHFFEPLKDIITTGPTYTNVNDLRLFLML